MTAGVGGRSAQTFVATAAPTRDELRGVIARVIARLETIGARRAKRSQGEGDGTSDDGMEGLRRTAGGRGAFARVDERGACEDDDDERVRAPLQQASRGLVAEVGGFNRHAGVRVAADDRDGLERLCRYMARPAVASGRVRVLSDGNVVYRVKSPRSAGATHRVMTPMEFMARLSALVAPPRTPLVRYHGVLAPNSPWRVAVVPLPPVEVTVGCARTEAAPLGVAVGVKTAAVTAMGPGARGGAGPMPIPNGRIDWARLMWRVWAVDVLLCPGCSGRMKMIAALTERAAIVRILEHLDVSIEVPRMRRSRDGP